MIPGNVREHAFAYHIVLYTIYTIVCVWSGKFEKMVFQFPSMSFVQINPTTIQKHVLTITSSPALFVSKLHSLVAVRGTHAYYIYINEIVNVFRAQAFYKQGRDETISMLIESHRHLEH